MSGTVETYSVLIAQRPHMRWQAVSPNATYFSENLELRGFCGADPRSARVRLDPLLSL